MKREMQPTADAASQNSVPIVTLTAKPEISIKSGKNPGPITIKLSDRSRGAVM